MACDEKIKSEVIEVIGDFFSKYSEKDAQGILNLIAPDSDVQIIGAGADEWRCGLTQLKKGFDRDFAQCDRLKTAFKITAVSNAGKVAWISGYLMLTVKIAKQNLKSRYRLSVILEKRKTRWYIVHLHLSEPAISQEAGKSFATSKSGKRG